jgi:hypothetical protein
MKDEKDLLAYCGLYCGACSFRVAFEEKDHKHLQDMPSKYEEYKDAELQFCPGCRLDAQSGGCKIRDCAVSKDIPHCGDCDEFPCELLIEFNNDGIPHHSDAINNLRKLRNQGEEVWLIYQAKRWECECGAKLSWYLKKCTKCLKPVKINYTLNEKE